MTNMKAFLAAILVAGVLGAGAYAVLSNTQKSAEVVFSTTGVRL
jgi:hypothetical protein